LSWHQEGVQMLLRPIRMTLGMGLVFGLAAVSGCAQDADQSALGEQTGATDAVVSSTAVPAAPEATEFFGLDTVFQEAQVRSGVWVVMGMLEPVSGEPADLVVAGAVASGDEWEIRLWQSIEVAPAGCSPLEPADSLLPGSSTLIAQCLVGGSDAASRVVVVGAPTGHPYPELLLNASCGAVDVTVEGDVMTIAKLPPRSEEGGAAEEFTLRWADDRLHVAGTEQLDQWNDSCINTTGSFSDTPSAPGS
jgi:hypothetical protein